MSLYASQTTVSPEKSRAEIEATLKRYGAASFMFAYEESRAMIGFAAHGRRCRFDLPLPSPKEAASAIRHGRPTELKIQAALEQETRRRWRALALAIKAKLEMVSSGITTFEAEFLAHIVLPGGDTVEKRVSAAIAEAYKSGKVGPLLLEAAPEDAR